MRSSTWRINVNENNIYHAFVYRPLIRVRRHLAIWQPNGDEFQCRGDEWFKTFTNLPQVQIRHGVETVTNRLSPKPQIDFMVFIFQTSISLAI